MAIVSYDDLKTKVPQWAERADITEPLIEDFIGLAESEANQQLRVPAMENVQKLVVTDGRVVIPFDFMELRALTHEKEDQVLQYLSWNQFVAINREGGIYQDTTTPMYFSRQGPNWFVSVEPADTSEILCHYYRYIPALSNTVTTNWLLEISPQAYLFGSLKYLFEYVMDTDKAAYWADRFDKELNRLQAIADRAEHMGTRLSVQTIN